MLYRILPTGRFLFLRKLIDSPICTLCKKTEDTLLHSFWECEKVETFWMQLENWLHTSFPHCSSIVLSRELILLGYKENIITDRIFDLIILMAKYHIYTSKLRNVNPYLNCFIRKVKHMYKTEVYRLAINEFFKANNDWLLYNLHNV